MLFPLSYKALRWKIPGKAYRHATVSQVLHWKFQIVNTWALGSKRADEIKDAWLARLFSVPSISLIAYHAFQIVWVAVEWTWQLPPVGKDIQEQGSESKVPNYPREPNPDTIWIRRLRCSAWTAEGGRSSKDQRSSEARPDSTRFHKQSGSVKYHQSTMLLRKQKYMSIISNYEKIENVIYRKMAYQLGIGQPLRTLQRSRNGGQMAPRAQGGAKC